MCCTALGNGMQSVMSNVADFVRTLPCHHHVVVVTLVSRRHQTNVRIEIQELEGGGKTYRISAALFFQIEMSIHESLGIC